jgi:hypothetical protein
MTTLLHNANLAQGSSPYNKLGFRIKQLICMPKHYDILMPSTYQRCSENSCKIWDVPHELKLCYGIQDFDTTQKAQAYMGG